MMIFSFKHYFKKLRSVIIGVAFISVLPSIIFNVQRPYMKAWEYNIKGHTYSIFPEIFDKYAYSMIIFCVALLLGLVCSLLLTFLTAILPRTIKHFVYSFLTILESLPDLLIVIVLQLSIVFIYKKTGLLVGNVSSFYEDKIYFAPIITLSVLPSIHLFKITFLLLEEEKEKPYVVVARSMGLGKYTIILQHVMRNVFFNLFLYFKTIFIFMLSNLLIIEYVFNIHGIMMVMLHSSGFAFFTTVMFIAIPFLALFEFVQNIVILSKGKKEVEVD
jgi:peptide/nickel transport system permease protein